VRAATFNFIRPVDVTSLGSGWRFICHRNAAHTSSERRCKGKTVEGADDVVAGRHYFDPFLVCKSDANGLFAE
jgi:hypothetical protein